MTQEEKELLFKDLCARLPYEVKYIRGSWNYETDQGMSVIETLDYIDKDGYISHTKVYTVEDIKPCLFPLSSMTEEQYKEWCDLGEEPLDEILRKNANGIKMTTLEHHLLVAKSMIDPSQWCYKNHFDVNGLIPKGLAEDATGLNIY